MVSLQSNQPESQLQQMAKDLEIAEAAKKEGDIKLRGALKRNEQLLSELKELGEAVRSL